MNPNQEIIREILEKRGITGEETQTEFLAETPKLAYAPTLLTNMDKGVDRLLQAIDAGKRIVIYGDYDADGVTSTVVLLKILRCLTDNITYYIPSRIAEGYGLHNESIDRIREEGGEFIVTVDCGSSSPDEIAYARSLGIDMVVTDHHNMKDEPVNELIINPRAPGDTYPFKGLAGVGVAYKLGLAVSRKREIPRRVISEVLEFVAIGTIADIMPLLDENRSFVKYGLKWINRGCRNPGLRRLIELSGLDCRNLTATNVSFGIAPRINAAGRVGDADLGVKLFLAEKPDEIENYCRTMIERNNLRKQWQEDAYRQCIVKARQEYRKGNFLLIEAKDVHEGILGIVAGKIKEEAKRPTVIVAPNGDEYKGTGRSVNKVDIYEMLNRYRDCFLRFGGHKAACGFTVEPDRIESLRQNLNRDLAEMLEKDSALFEDEITYDLDLEPDEVSLELAEALRCFEPCGKDNEAPKFRITYVMPENWHFLKNDTKYARFQIGDLDCVLFHDAKRYFDMMQNHEFLDVYGTLDINTWRDTRKVQLMVTEMAPTEDFVG